MYKLYIGDIYFNFVICIHEINKLFYLSLEACTICKSYSYGVYNKICSLCYDNNNYDSLVKKYNNVLDVIYKFNDYDKHSDCINVYLESVIKILDPDKESLYDSVNIKLKLYMIKHILSRDTKRSALLNMFNSSFFICAKLNRYVLYPDIIKYLINNDIKVNYIISFEYIKYHFVLIVAIIVKFNNSKCIIRFVYRTCKKGFIIENYKDKNRLEKLIKCLSFMINKNVRLDALTYDIISRHYKKTHNYITKTLLNHIDKYDTDDIEQLSYIKTSLKYKSIKSISRYKKKEKGKSETIIKHRNDKEIIWTDIYFNIFIDDCYNENQDSNNKLPETLVLEDEINNDIRQIQYNSIFYKFLISIDDFMYRWFSNYRNKCISCNINVKINYYGECNKCAFLRKEYNIIKSEYKNIIEAINKLPISNYFIDVLQDIYDKTLILRKSNNIFDYEKYKKSINKKSILGNVLLLYMKKCNNSLYIKKYENINHTIKLEFLYCKKYWNSIMNLMFIELNIENQLNIIIKREIKFKNYYRFFDFVVYKNNKECLIIEIDDRSHDNLIGKKSDKIKNQICNENNLKIFRFSIRDYEYGILNYNTFLDRFILFIQELKSYLFL